MEPKKWKQPVYVKTAQDLISRMNDKDSKVLKAHQGKFGSQWMNVVSYKNLGLKIDVQQLRISNSLRLGANICVAHICIEVKELNVTVHTVFFAPRELVTFHVMRLSNLSLSRRRDLSTCPQCSNRVGCIELMANAQAVLL